MDIGWRVIESSGEYETRLFLNNRLYTDLQESERSFMMMTFSNEQDFLQRLLLLTKNFRWNKLTLHYIQ